MQKMRLHKTNAQSISEIPQKNQNSTTIFSFFFFFIFCLAKISRILNDEINTNKFYLNFMKLVDLIF